MRNVILLGLALLWASASWAADDFRPLNVKPGLWEATMTSQVSGLPPIPAEVLARLTPEQRERMEAAMKGRAGGGPQSRVTKSCLTPEQLNKPLTFDDNKNTACKSTLIRSSASQQEIRMDCSQGDVRSSGTVHIEAIDSEHVKGTSEVNTSGGDNKMNIQISYAAKWVGADCGDLKKK